jgi:hypothetical protein
MAKGLALVLAIETIKEKDMKLQSLKKSAVTVAAQL